LVPIVVLVVGVALGVFAVRDLLPDGWTGLLVIGGFLLFCLGHYLWWKLIARLEETPHSP
jgi:hypothetical protein